MDKDDFYEKEAHFRKLLNELFESAHKDGFSTDIVNKSTKLELAKWSFFAIKTDKEVEK